MARKLKELGYALVSDGTDNHLVLVNLKSKVDHFENVLCSKIGTLENWDIIFSEFGWSPSRKRVQQGAHHGQQEYRAWRQECLIPQRIATW